ncbi:MAG TPA: hypothetical protein VMF30_05885 [Pirellulales bacterium]|nr:hypothetical protein [Pirellulales bacterium]
MLKIDGHAYSPALLQKILTMAGSADSFEAAATALRDVGEIEISARTVNQLSAQLGGELADERNRRTQTYEQQPLPRVPTVADPPPSLAAVFCDGGRMRTRAAGCGHGIHHPHWRETKNAAFHRMRSTSHDHDPQPDLPDCLRNQAYVERLVLGLKKAKNPQPELIPTPAAEPQPRAEIAEVAAMWQPQTVVRTCVSSLAGSDEFGPMMAAEADTRGFFAADKRAFVGDGQKYNWSIQERWFPTFRPIVDFIHVVEYVYDAAKALCPDPVQRWTQYVAWARACWQANTCQVLQELSEHLSAMAADEPGCSGEGPRQTIQRTLTYLTNNGSRMDYPCYRREGLPVTSSLAESLVKQISKRVKGTEKFWDDGPRGEAILQIRAALISQDNRLARFIRNRPICPYSPRCRPLPLNSPR